MIQNSNKRTSMIGKDISRYPQVKCKRCGMTRRVKPSQGFYFSHTVGWVCRRELTRRKLDGSD